VAGVASLVAEARFLHPFRLQGLINSRACSHKSFKVTESKTLAISLESFLQRRWVTQRGMRWQGRPF